MPKKWKLLFLSLTILVILVNSQLLLVVLGGHERSDINWTGVIISIIYSLHIHIGYLMLPFVFRKKLLLRLLTTILMINAPILLHVGLNPLRPYHYCVVFKKDPFL